MDGRIVTQLITPKATPFIMTMPTSSPNVKLMKHRAAKPAIVVMEEPTTDWNVAWMAEAIASLLSAVCSIFSSKLCHRKME